MPRKRFELAKDAAARRVDCVHYSLNGGAPRCDALTNPWCLAPGRAPEACSFRKPADQPADKPADQPADKPVK